MLGFRELAITSLFAFVLVLIMGPVVLPALHRFKFGQTVRDDGPQTHLKKNGTPTMGGLMIIVAILLVTLIRSGISTDILMALLCMFVFAIIGFVLLYYFYNYQRKKELEKSSEPEVEDSNDEVA